MKEGEENERIDVHVPLQIGVVFNPGACPVDTSAVHVPLQIGVVFNISAEKHC